MARVAPKSAQPRVLETLGRLGAPWDKAGEEEKLDLLRTYQVVFTRMGPPDAASRDMVLKKLDPLYPAVWEPVNRELCQLLVYLDAPKVIDRTLALTRGAGMTLAMPGRSAITLTPASQPLAFPGEMPIDATLPGGPADDLNVMTRRGRFAHRMTLREIDGPIELSRGTGLLIVSSRDGDLECEHDGARHLLAPGDLAILDEGETPLRIVPRGVTGLYEIRIRPA